MGEYYVYGWYNKDWNCFFYVGKGTGARYKTMHNRGRAFRAVVENWSCFPVLLVEGLTEEEALEREEHMKCFFLFEKGYPIIDGEGSSGMLKSLAARDAKRKLRETDPNYREGRPPVDCPDFEKFLKKQKEGKITVAEAIQTLGISRATWYNLARRAS